MALTVFSGSPNPLALCAIMVRMRTGRFATEMIKSNHGTNAMTRQAFALSTTARTRALLQNDIKRTLTATWRLHAANTTSC